MYEYERKPITFIATRLERSYGGVHQILKEEGVRFRRRGGNANPQVSYSEYAAQAWLYEVGMPAKTIGEVMAMSTNTVQSRLARAGINGRSHSERGKPMPPEAQAVYDHIASQDKVGDRQFIIKLAMFLKDNAAGLDALVAKYL